MFTKKFLILSAALLFIAAIMAGCQSPAPQPVLATEMRVAATTPVVPTLPTATLVVTPTNLPTAAPSPTNRPKATETTAPPTATQALPTTLPTDVPTSTAMATAVPSAFPTVKPASLIPGAGGSGNIKIYLISPKTGGPIGCGDSAVAITTNLTRGHDQAKDIEAALDYLFSLKSKYYGSLYNPVANSILRVQEVDIKNGLLTVWLSGKYIATADKCDNARVKAQVFLTAKQFGGFTNANFYLNGLSPFGDYVSSEK